jgi:hypothetical protein
MFAFAAGAFAHHPEVEAYGFCDAKTGTYKISYTSNSWCTGSTQCEHDNIAITINGVPAGGGAYTPGNGYQFSSTVDAPSGSEAGDSVGVMASAIGQWNNGSPSDCSVPACGGTAKVYASLPEDPNCAPASGRFTGGGKQLMINIPRGTLHVTRGFTLHCDLLLSNNLEVNWSGGNKFHMTEHLSAICLDDPSFDPFPPAAPVDTLIGVGTGRYNGDDGYTITWRMEDHGEPGSEDQMSILITGPGGTVLDVPLQKLEGGNIQAHFDQPHK